MASDRIKLKKVKKRKQPYIRRVKGRTQTVRKHEQGYYVGRNPPVTKTSRDQLEEWIGEKALDNRNWITLDSEYPNVKGVSPEKIEWLINQFPDKRSEEGKKGWNKLKERHEANAPYLDENMAFETLFYRGFTKSDVKDIIKNRIRFYDRDEICSICYDLHTEHKKLRKKERERDILFVNDKFNDIIKGFKDENSLLLWRVQDAIQFMFYDDIEDINPDGTKETEEKLCKYYVKQIMKSLWLEDIEPPKKLIKLIEQKRNLRDRSVTGKEMLKIDWNVLREKIIKEIKETDIPDERQTIYVTSPRGGYELLSIYAYSNNINKANIPSDIIHKGEINFLTTGTSISSNFESRKEGFKMLTDEKVGMTFIGNVSGEGIKRVVVVDDTVGSGQQMEHFYKVLRTKFPDAKIYYQTVAARKPKYRTLSVQQEIDSEGERLQKLYSNRGFSAVTCGDETIGLKGYAKGDKGLVSVVFPWAVPDGSADVFSRLLLKPEDDRMRNVAFRTRG